MVFRWLFGGGGGASHNNNANNANNTTTTANNTTTTTTTTSNGNERSKASAQATPESGHGPSPADPAAQPAYSADDDDDDDTLAADDAAPVAGEHTSPPLAVPLTAIPSFMVDDRPELRLSPYDMARCQYPANVLALVHNAVRLEMADMWGDILPSIQSRCHHVHHTTLEQPDADDIRDWWSGFARFALTVSLVDEFVTKKAFDDVYVGFDKEAKLVQKAFLKLQEKNTVYLESAVRTMAKSVAHFETDVSTAGFTQLVNAWEALASMLADIYAASELLIQSIDRWMKGPVEYKDLEKQIAKIFTNKKRWGDDETKRGEMIVVLCRWFGTEDLMREWMFRNLTKKELKAIDRWMDDYRDRRLAIIDRFHQKKV